MPIRIFKPIKLGKGLKLNLSKSGLGLSQRIGPVTLGTRRNTVDLPGTGASVYSTHKKGKKTKTASTGAWIALFGGFIVIMCCICFGFMALLGVFDNSPTPTPAPLMRSTEILIKTSLPSATNLPPTLTPPPSMTFTSVPAPTRRPTWTLEPTFTTIPTIEPVIVQPTNISTGCNPAYPDVCITHDQNCTELKAKGIYNFRVLAPDPYGFDRDNDGIGCEN
jgi:micrococcal nuclease